ncbi:hypothetical protein CXF96_12035 [Stenotrophomonas sp. Betaine-02u-21]|nr:hypothetical protein CXF90_09445 [Stenotrophomonas sp. Betaine-02u-23]PKH73425.1 hypothetical protein CXF96_12035 [Stenotrophomonas sp. Betaine-02u-21]PKH95278.1 hypothetical protein CXG43_13680 [Stenotrophomonas sp. Bg11-02]
MALVMVAPLISRSLAEHPAPRAALAPVEAAANPHMGSAHDMHHGMQHAMHHDMTAPQPPAHAASSETEPPDPHAKHEMGVECDYCLIAARMISLLVALLLLLTVWPAAFGTITARHPTRPAPALGTLGARGPPAIAC